jgi:hypothetical protein
VPGGPSINTFHRPTSSSNNDKEKKEEKKEKKKTKQNKKKKKNNSQAHLGARSPLLPTDTSSPLFARQDQKQGLRVFPFSFCSPFRSDAMRRSALAEYCTGALPDFFMSPLPTSSDKII